MDWLVCKELDDFSALIDFVGLEVLVAGDVVFTTFRARLDTYVVSKWA